MKSTHFLVTGLITANLLVACSSPSGNEAAPNSASTPTGATQALDANHDSARRASATGTITAVDPVAKTITIEHGPVPALEWPAMTMTFQAAQVDLDGFKAGDRISFEVSASGMGTEVTALKHE